MENKTTTVVLSVVIVALLLILIVEKQAKTPLYKTLLKQQQEILNSQRSLEKAYVEKITLLEQRLAKVESQWLDFQNILKKAMGPADGRPQEDLNKVYDIEVAHSPIRGNKEAPVTIVEFVDFQCPFCARFHEPIVEVLKAYPDKVKFILKNFPLSFHPQAAPASKAAFAAGEQGKYYEMVDLLLENGSALSDDKFKELAKTLGLNADKFWKDYTDKDAQWEDYIKKDMELGERVNVQGTPTFYLNGRQTRARTLDAFKAEIDKILAEKNK